MMSLDWEEKQLKDVLGYEQPTNYLVDSIDYNNEFDTPVLTAGKSFLLGYTDEKHGIYKDLPAIIFDDFTTAFHYVDFPFKVKSSAMKILTCDKGKNDLKFLYYLMKTLNIDTELHKRYWISRFSKLKFNRPPLKTQKRIAEILDNAAALREKTEQLLTEYDALAQSIFLDMFGDPITNPKEWSVEVGDNLFSFKSGKFLKTTSDDISLYPVFGGNGIKGYSEKFLIDFDTFVIGRVGAYCGAIHRIKNQPIWVTDNAIYINDFKKNLNLTYLHYFLNGYDINRFADKSGQPKITQRPLKEMLVFTPPIELQNEFAEKIELIEKQKELAKQELKESEDLFNALLQKAFKGELV